MGHKKSTGNKHGEVIVAGAPEAWPVLGLYGSLISMILLAVCFVNPENVCGGNVGPLGLFWLKVGLAGTTSCLIYILVSVLRFGVTLKSNEIIVRGLFSTHRFPLSEIKELFWHARKSCLTCQIVVHGEEQKRHKIYSSVSSYRRVVRYLRETIPLEKQVGWKEYYLQNRDRMKEIPSCTEQLASLRLLFIVILGYGLFWVSIFVFTHYVKKIIPAFVSSPWLFSVVTFFIWLGFSVFIMWPTRRKHKPRSIICPIAIKMSMVLFFLYLWFVGSAAIWNWFSEKQFGMIALLAIVISLVGVLLIWIFCGEDREERKTRLKLIREAEDAECEKYAELLLPPELER